jgi:ABC-2 type transport system ATP-binding protein
MVVEAVSAGAGDNVPPLVSVRNLVKRFGTLAAVNDISFEIKEGEIFGFLGPNGAGKSTTIKMICTLLVPTEGRITVADSDVMTQADAVRARIGIVFQDNSLDSGLTALENLHFHCMMYHIPRAERAHRIDEVLRMVDLTEHQGRIVKTYSGGMRRRLEIARGLLHRPNLLVLDEPTVGLDPQTRRYIWSYIHQLRQEHRMAIFMTTHYMDEAENCDRIAILDKGVIVALDTPAALKKLVGEDQVELTTRNNGIALEVMRAKYGIDAAERDGKVKFEVEDAEHFVPRLLADFSQSPEGLVVESLHIRRPTLEDVFLKLTGRLIREEEGDKDERRLAMRQRGRL